ncbi:MULTISPECIES: cation diffusion facilitator family transporter [unclassified Novosphingobium]|uniref:cation diffusion facilitator family transporter n=1 Tax=unclassified Novosphingobium TaxID=2644732 RepID=UPI00146F4B50|nr:MULTISPECIES: cation diffusion facilitator family transporter [unclassified Novosphingobium]NMN03063.1 cobalt-zinc-cadmium efflux system protein [Novosphingobium sp. SG919]NMN86949.1 cobalt-zinc-cadmium efflux system protein [Novosphingobium sp. SG916]
MSAGHHHHHHHDHAHGHHHHGPGHSHAPASFGRAFALGIALNTGFVLVEGGYGIASGSMALVADAGHNLSDVLSLIIAWAASVLSARPPKGRFTYGFKSSSILAALGNAALLMVALGAILVESLRRLMQPEAVAPGPVMIVAGIGIVINTATALLFMRGSKHDLNLRGAYLHMAADAAVSAGVVLAGLAIALTGWAWIDPATSLVIVAVIAVGTWGLARDSLKLGLQAVPEGIDPARVSAALGALPGVARVHDLHIWPMSTTETALTAHLIMPGGHPGDAFLAGLAHDLEHDFGIGHTTIQVETDDCGGCSLGA